MVVVARQEKSSIDYGVLKTLEIDVVTTTLKLPDMTETGSQCVIGSHFFIGSENKIEYIMESKI